MSTPAWSISAWFPTAPAAVDAGVEAVAGDGFEDSRAGR